MSNEDGQEKQSSHSDIVVPYGTYLMNDQMEVAGQLSAVHVAETRDRQVQQPQSRSFSRP